MGAGRYILITWLLIPALSGCVTASSGANAPTASAQLQDKVALLEAQLKQQQDENALLRQQLAQAKKEVRLPSGKEIQLALMKAGYYKGEIDGQIGSRTKDAIKKFQSANGLDPDGVIGSRTWQLLRKYLDQAG